MYGLGIIYLINKLKQINNIKIKKKVINFHDHDMQLARIQIV